MKAMILDGGKPGDLLCTAAAKEVKSLLEAKGYSVDIFSPEEMKIAPCLGCFACWATTPGRCVHNDDAGKILSSWANADILIWTTPIVWGGYSPSLKKALDRCIPLILPFFIKVRGEVHHPLRYSLPRKTVVIGTLPQVDPESEMIFRNLAERNAINMHSVPEVFVLHENGVNGAWKNRFNAFVDELAPGFPETAVLSEGSSEAFGKGAPIRKALFIVGSPRGQKSTSMALAKRLAGGLKTRGVEVETALLRDVVDSAEKTGALVEAAGRADLVVFSFPLYVDHLPAPLIRFLEILSDRPAGLRSEGPGVLAAIVQCGFPETHQNKPALDIMRRFAAKSGFRWAGGLAMGMGGALGGNKLEKGGGMAKNAIRALDLAAENLAKGRPIPAEAVRTMGRPLMPTWLYILAANLSFRMLARKHGAGKDLKAMPYLSDK
jgi:multimeric flavodoxin WrbA